MKFAKYTLPTFLMLALVACENSQYGQKQTGGAIIGAIGGGLLGSQLGGGKGTLAATAAGTLLGAWLGSEGGKSLDRADRLAMQHTSQRALETQPDRQVSTWSNPNTGHSGSVTPTRTYQTAQGQNCREYQQTVVIGGQTESAYGTACRQRDGTWKISN